MNIHKKIAAINRYANKGNTLTYFHKHIIHRISIGCRTPHDMAMLHQTYMQVKQGTYQKLKDCHFGVQHITQNSNGYIYYKGKHVEHYSYETSQWLEEWKATLALAKTCKLFEKKGHPINYIAVGWGVQKYLTPEEIATCENVDAEIFRQTGIRFYLLKNKKLLNRLKARS